MTREQNGEGLSLWRSSNECIGDLSQPSKRSVVQISEPRPKHFASIRRLAKLIRGSWLLRSSSCPSVSIEQIRELLDSLYRVDSGRILATLIRLLGGF